MFSNLMFSRLEYASRYKFLSSISLKLEVCDESLIMLSISSLTDRTRKDFKQMKSDIETLKTLVSATKEEGEFPHTVARWKFKVSV